MGKYIDADKLKAEIERRKEKWLAASRLIKKGKDKAMYAAGKSSGYTEFFSLINSLQQEQPEVGVENYIQSYLESIGFGYGGWVDGLRDEDLKKIARHFYELGLNTRKEE